MRKTRTLATATLTLALTLLWIWTTAEATPQERPLGQLPKGKCVGITTERLGERVVRVYRAFEDGTVEAWDDGGDAQGWTRVGK
jgi:hypothetical protein